MKPHRLMDGGILPVFASHDIDMGGCTFCGHTSELSKDDRQSYTCHFVVVSLSLGCFPFAGTWI